MESVHMASRRAWIDNNIINIQEFLQDYYSETLDLPDTSLSNPLDSSVPEEEPYDFEKECGLDAMKCNLQERMESTKHFDIPDGVQLKTLSYHKEDLEKRKNNKKYAASHYNFMRYTRYPPHKVFKADLEKLKPMPVEVPDVVLIVQIHVPERWLNPKVVRNAKMPAFHVDQEFLVLGCQYLTELREKINCMSDNAIPGDHSDCPNSLPTTTCKDVYKSGFFYINGVFYNDMRDKDCRDYSETIIKWSKNRCLGPFEKARMEETRFIDLNIQLGYPYVYVHQGECEHIIVFTDLRLFSKYDVNNKNAYPLYTQVKSAKRTLCMICRRHIARWVVRESKRLPEDPYFFCQDCFIKFNYDTQNQKIGEFKAYFFPDRSVESLK